MKASFTVVLWIARHTKHEYEITREELAAAHTFIHVFSSSQCVRVLCTYICVRVRKGDVRISMYLCKRFWHPIQSHPHILVHHINVENRSNGTFLNGLVENICAARAMVHRKILLATYMLCSIHIERARDKEHLEQICLIFSPDSECECARARAILKSLIKWRVCHY